MGITSENVAQRYGVTRLEQDQAVVESHRRAADATASGKFKDEIVPVSTKIVDPKSREEKKIIVSVDDGIRPNANLVDLAKLKPAFKKDGSTTAGNASQVSDGATAVLLMKRSVAVQKGLPILGIFRSFVVVGVDPVVMGTGPAFAIPAAVKSAGLELGNIDLFEINEAFASQFLYSCKKLGLDSSKVNVNGGVIAVGHPLGATGARCVATLLNEMKRCGKDCHFGVISMCIGFAAMRGIGTMGAANSTSKEANFSSSAIWLKNAPNYVSALGAEIGNNSIPQNNLEPEGFAETRGNKFIPGFPLGTTWEDTAMISDNITGLKRYKDDDDDVKPFSAGLNPAETKNETGGQPPTAPLAHQMSMPNTTAELEAIEKFLQFSDSVPCKIRDKRGCATHPRSIAERCSDFFI